jgi:prophage regulatory protein
MQKFVTDRQLAERYSVSRASIWRWSQTGQLPKPISLASGTTRWNLEDVLNHEQHLERRRTSSAT